MADTREDTFSSKTDRYSQQAGNKDDDGFGHLPFDQNQERGHRNPDSPVIVDRMLAEHEDRPGNGPSCCGGDALDEGPDLHTSRETLVEGADDYDEKIYRQENTQRRRARAGDPRNKVTDERNGYHYRTGCNHGYGYGIKKLGFRQPVMLLDHASMKKWDNRQAAAKDKQTRLPDEYQ